MKNNRIYLSPPHMGNNEQLIIKKAFQSNWITSQGPQLELFENKISNYIDIKKSVAVSSGTAAIHLALLSLGIKKNDTVICQSFTFVGTANPVIYLGAEPIFVDSENDTWNMDPNNLINAIKSNIRKGKKPKAIIFVHLYGMPAKIHEIKKISKKYNIPIVEDAAEALGSSYKNLKCGSFGDIGILSFNGNKIITTSGGGALLSNNYKLMEKAKFLSTQAKDKYIHYEHSNIGYNYRMSNILAAIGIAQLSLINKRVKSRRNNFKIYKKYLSKFDGINFLEEPNNSKNKDMFFSNRWLTTIIFDKKILKIINKNKIIKIFEKENIEVRPLWKPMHLQPIFKKYQYFGKKNAQNLFKNGLCLPSGSNLKLNDFDRIFSCFNKVFK